jgi:gliding motility-associated-like protein
MLTLTKLLLCILLILAIIIIPKPVEAQLCQGSLGDPVVNITFGAGTNPGQPLKAATTSYSFKSADCPDDGFYTITNSTTTCFNNTWHSLPRDHTGNPNGYFMLVNASFQPSAFYIDTVKGLCGGTTYEFAAWIINVMKPQGSILPNITFTIETTSGTVLQTYNTRDIEITTSPQWKQYGFYFATPANTSAVVLRMVNNTIGGIGNDLALDDITFRPCGPKVTSQMDGGITSKEICEGDQTIFTFNSSITSGYSNPTYQWQVSTNGGTSWTDILGATSTSYTRQPTGPGVYQYRLAAAQSGNISAASCRVASELVTINVNARPEPNASTNDPACEGDTLRLTAADGGAAYVWTGPDGFTSSLQNPVISKTTTAHSGKYYVTMTIPPGCSNIDSTEAIFNKVPVASAGSDISICEGTSATLRGNGDGTYSWSPAHSVSNANSATTIASPRDTTNYILTVSNGQCKGYDTASVFVWKKPTANAGPDQKIYEGDTVQLSGTAGGTGVSYAWTPAYRINNNTILNPVVRPSFDFTYTLKVASPMGCGTASDNVFIRVYRRISIPNAFSPNNDGINDTWDIVHLNTYPEASISVFNRNGQKVYESMGYAKQWDGRYNGAPLPVGTYYYVIDLKNAWKPFSGWVMILR